MKKYLITGFITLLPIVITLMIVRAVFDFFTEPFFGIMERILIAYEESIGADLKHHDLLVTFISRLLVLIVLFITVFILGFFAHKFFIKALVRLTNRLFSKIPLIKTIYRMTKEVTKATFAQDKKTFKQTVLIPFPSDKTHALGLVTGELPPALKKIITEAEVTVFVPTAPHPISGFMLMTPKKHLLNVDMTTEETFKFLLSCGVIHPKEETEEPS